MNYDQFRTLFQETLDAAGLLRFPPWPSETLDLCWLSRTYGISVSLRNIQRAGLFHITRMSSIRASLNWRWDAGLAARSATTEEDLLVELLGQDGYYLVTEPPDVFHPPWLRVDITLQATLPMDAPRAQLLSLRAQRSNLPSRVQTPQPGFRCRMPMPGAAGRLR